MSSAEIIPLRSRNDFRERIGRALRAVLEEPMHATILCHALAELQTLSEQARQNTDALSGMDAVFIEFLSALNMTILGGRVRVGGTTISPHCAVKRLLQEALQTAAPSAIMPSSPLSPPLSLVT